MNDNDIDAILSSASADLGLTQTFQPDENVASSQGAASVDSDLEALRNLRDQLSGRSSIDSPAVTVVEQGILHQALNDAVTYDGPTLAAIERLGREAIDAANQAIAETTEEAPQSSERERIMNALNSKTRFKGAEWFSKLSAQRVTVVGIGGIGSWLSLLLSRLGVGLNLYDMDTVSRVNLAGQLYKYADIGRGKCAALNDTIQMFNDGYVDVNTYSRMYTGEYYTPNFVMCGLDNMASRQTIFHNWWSNNKGDRFKVFIDGRLSPEGFQIFSMCGTDTDRADRYMKDWLFSDEEADAAVCSYKQTTFMAAMIASVMTNILINYVSEDEFRNVPFYTEYSGDTMLFKNTD